MNWIEWTLVGAGLLCLYAALYMQHRRLTFKEQRLEALQRRMSRFRAFVREIYYVATPAEIRLLLTELASITAESRALKITPIYNEAVQLAVAVVEAHHHVTLDEEA